MTWNSIGDFIAMGGYGGYVWGSYAVTAMVIAVELIAVRRRFSSAQRALDARRTS